MKGSLTKTSVATHDAIILVMSNAMHPRWREMEERRRGARQAEDRSVDWIGESERRKIETELEKKCGDADRR